jgi:hypothetical protein
MLLRRITAEPCYLYLPTGYDELLALDESGPGYQLLRIGAPLPNARDPVRAADYVVLNAELLVPIEIVWDDVWDPTLVWLGALSYDSCRAALNATVVASLGAPALPISGNAPGGGGTTTGPPGPQGPGGPPRSTMTHQGTTTAGQTAWRVSAYNPDRRITGNSELLAGAYTTSDPDKTFINTGLGGVGRNALPMPFPACNAYQISPAPGTPFVAGTVRPAFGQAGGGVEVVFHVTTPPGSVAAPRILPDL